MGISLDIISTNLKGYRFSDRLNILPLDKPELSSSGEVLIFHALFGQPMICSMELVKLLVQLMHNSIPSPDETIETDQAESLLSSIEQFKNRNFLIKEGSDERKVLLELQNGHINSLDKPGSLCGITLIPNESCNFRCTYCIQRDCRESFLDNKKLMHINDAIRYVDSFFLYLSQAVQKPARIWIDFNGGEVLLAFNTVKAIVERCSQIHEKNFPESKLEYHISTNLSLATPSIRRYLKRHHFTVYTSLDGIKKFHNSVRLDALGNPTYDLLMRRFQEFQDDNFPIDRVSVTVTDKNYKGVTPAWLKKLKAIGIKGVGVDYDLIHSLDRTPMEIVKHLKELCFAAWGLNMLIRGNWSDPFTYLLNEDPLNELVAFCEPYQLRSFTVGPSGDISLCPFIYDPVGHIEDFGRTGKLGIVWKEKVLSRLPGRQERCYDCAIEGVCGGGCQGTIMINDNNLFENWCYIFRTMTEFLLRNRERWYATGLRYGV